MGIRPERDPSIPMAAPKPTTMAIMQPYFIPYAGYFRLFATSDVFVIYDCVQFPRRGWVHRNRLLDASDKEAWLTLHLEKAPLNVLISELRFAPDAGERLDHDLRRFPDAGALPDEAVEVAAALMLIEGTP